MDRRTFIKTSAIAAASLPVLGRATHLAGEAAGTLRVTIHGGFAHIFQRRNGEFTSLLFGPARATHAHPHGIRMHVPTVAIAAPSRAIPYGVAKLTPTAATTSYIWDLAGWDVEILADGEVPAGTLNVNDKGVVQNPTQAADWNRLAHIPDLTALGAGKLRRDFRAHMTCSVLLHGGTILIDEPSENCARQAGLKFNGARFPVSDVLIYEIPMKDSLTVRATGSGLSETVTLVPNTPGTLDITIDFPPTSEKLYTHGEALHHYSDLSALGEGGQIVPTYDLPDGCQGQGSPGKYCPGGRYTRDL